MTMFFAARAVAGGLLLALLTSASGAQVATPVPLAGLNQEQPTSTPQLPAGEPGASTRAWLDLQRSGRQGGKSNDVPGQVADASWRRYLDTFRRPIPESLASPERSKGAAQ